MWEMRHFIRARFDQVIRRGKVKDRRWIEKGVRSLGVGAQNAALHQEYHEFPGVIRLCGRIR